MPRAHPPEFRQRGRPIVRTWCGEPTRIQSRLRWHLHELFPGLVIAPKGLRRLHVLDDPTARPARRTRSHD
jgi:hypothetical protein